MNAPRVLGHSQYEALVKYEHGKPSWQWGGSPPVSLTRRGYLAIVPKSGHDRASSLFVITPDGLDALVRYRKRYEVPPPERAIL